MEQNDYDEYPKSVRITKKQREWFDRNSINFSDWVRQRIDEAMNSTQTNAEVDENATSAT